MLLAINLIRDTCDKSHHDNDRAMSSAYGGDPDIFGELHRYNCRAMSSAYGGDPDIFGELHRYNCRAINRTATLFVNLLLLCSDGIYATINIIPVNFTLLCNKLHRYNYHATANPDSYKI